MRRAASSSPLLRYGRSRHCCHTSTRILGTCEPRPGTDGAIHPATAVNDCGHAIKCEGRDVIPIADYHNPVNQRRADRRAHCIPAHCDRELTPNLRRSLHTTLPLPGVLDGDHDPPTDGGHGQAIPTMARPERFLWRRLTRINTSVGSGSNCRVSQAPTSIQRLMSHLFAASAFDASTTHFDRGRSDGSCSALVACASDLDPGTNRWPPRAK